MILSLIEAPFVFIDFERVLYVSYVGHHCFWHLSWCWSQLILLLSGQQRYLPLLLRENEGPKRFKEEIRRRPHQKTLRRHSYNFYMISQIMSKIYTSKPIQPY